MDLVMISTDMCSMKKGLGKSKQLCGWTWVCKVLLVHR